MLKLYKTYNKAKNVFVKPRLHWYFGTWRKDPCLPVWRRGPILRLGGSTYKLNAKCYQISNIHHIKIHSAGDIKDDGTIYKYDYYDTIKHKLPGKLKNGDVVWKRKYRRLFRKFGLKIAKAYIQFPIWISFHVFNNDIFWKTKWDEYDFRYEFPPQFTIVFFGLSLSFWLNPEIKDPDTENFYHYWESLLTYLYGKHARDLLQTVIDCGKWEYKNKEGKKISYFKLSKNYIKPKYYKEYDKAIKLYKELIRKSKENEL